MPEIHDLMPTRLAMPMQVMTRAESGPSHDRLLELALAQASNPDALREHDPFIGSAISSSNAVDSHFTFMDEETTLPRFVEDQKSGSVVILDSHNSRQNGFGRAIWGELIDEGEKKLTRTFWYTPRNMRTSSGMMTDDYILGMETGIYRDVSVGFFRVDHTSMAECTICGLDMYGWDCPHWPGGRYLVHVDPKDDKSPKEERVALGKLVNWGNSELSYVYKGSNRDAQHEGNRATLHLDEAKVQMYVDAGELTYNEGVKLQRMYDFEIPNLSKLRTVHAVVKPETKTDPVSVDPVREQETPDMEWNNHYRQTYEETFGEAPSAAILALDPVDAFVAGTASITERYQNSVTAEDHRTVVEARDALQTEVDTLKPMADTGKLAMDRARAFAKAEAIRAATAMGTKKGLSEEKLDRLFANMDLDTLIDYTEQQTEIANTKLGEGGRKHREAPNVYDVNDNDEEDDDTNVRYLSPLNFVAR